MLCFGEPNGKILKTCAPFEVIKERHFVYLHQILRKIADLVIPGYGQAAPVIFRLTCDDAEQGGFSCSVVTDKPYPALGGYKPVYFVKDYIFFEIYLQIFYFDQFLRPPKLSENTGHYIVNIGFGRNYQDKCLSRAFLWCSADSSEKQTSLTSSITSCSLRKEMMVSTAISAARPGGKRYTPVEIAGNATVLAPMRTASLRLLL
jgi:hypothetical protein